MSSRATGAAERQMTERQMTGRQMRDEPEVRDTR